MENCIKLIFVAIMLFAFSCKNQHSANESTDTPAVITINNYKNQTIDIDSFTTAVDTTLLVMDKHIMASIKDLCMMDSSICVLDKMNTIAIFDIASGKTKKVEKRVGTGPGEYVSPQAIISDNDTIYVLDLQALCVLVYDKELNFIRKVRTNFPAMDFIKVDDGFLFYNLNATSKLKRIVYTDLNGHVINSFRLSERENDVLLSENVFSKDEKGNVYIMEPMSNIIREWRNEKIHDSFVLDFGSKTSNANKNSLLLKEQKEIVMQSHLTSKYVVTTFISNNKVYTNVYDKEQNKSFTGIMHTGLTAAFSPSLVYKGSIVDVYEPFFDEDETFDVDMVYVKYDLKK